MSGGEPVQGEGKKRISGATGEAEGFPRFSISETETSSDVGLVGQRTQRNHCAVRLSPTDVFATQIGAYGYFKTFDWRH